MHTDVALGLPLFAARRTIAQHPGVFTGAAALHRHHFGIGLGGDPGQATGQYPISLAAGHCIHTHADGTGLQLTVFGLPDRRLGQLSKFLRHIGIRTRLHALCELVALLITQITAKYRCKALGRKRRFDQQLWKFLQGLGQYRRFAAPPGGDGRQDQFFAEQELIDLRQETQQTRRLQHTAAEGVGHQHPPLPHSLKQARHAEGGVGSQLQRIAEVIVEPAHDRVDPTQATQGLQVDRGIAHRQVAALHQRITELASQIQMFKIAFVETPWCQQHHQRRVPATRGLTGQGFLQGAEEPGQVLHFQIAVQLGKGPGHNRAVFQRIPGSRRRLGTIRRHPPAAIGCARQIHGIQMQKGSVRRTDALTGPKEVVVTEHQLGGQQTFGNQPLRTVKVSQHGIEQSRPLSDTSRQLLPLISRDDMGQQVQLPWPVRALGVGIDVIGNAVFLNLPGQQGLTLHQLCRRAALQLLEQPAPVRAHGATVVEQFVIGARRQRVAV
ncbi:hypothetical protein D3C86_978590 [compost metagenome]